MPKNDNSLEARDLSPLKLFSYVFQIPVYGTRRNLVRSDDLRPEIPSSLPSLLHDAIRNTASAAIMISEHRRTFLTSSESRHSLSPPPPPTAVLVVFTFAAIRDGTRAMTHLLVSLGARRHSFHATTLTDSSLSCLLANLYRLR
jgi:hypothetical protein